MAAVVAGAAAAELKVAEVAFPSPSHFWDEVKGSDWKGLRVPL